MIKDVWHTLNGLILNAETRRSLWLPLLSSTRVAATQLMCLRLREHAKANYEPISLYTWQGIQNTPGDIKVEKLGFCNPPPH